MKIAYVTTHDPHDVGAWSGAIAQMGQALTRAGADMRYVGPLRARRPPGVVLGQVRNRVRGHRAFRPERDPAIGRGLAREALRQLAGAPVDVVLSPGTIPIAHMEHPAPIAFWTDATFADLVDYYPEYTGLERRSRRDGDALERAALTRSAVCIYTSQWAARSAIEYYGADPERVHVVPFGANIASPSDQVVREAVDARPSESCNLVFIGADWDRKGGDIAVETARILNAGGLPTTLTLLGAGPAGGPALPEFVRAHGFLHKGAADARTRMERALLDAHVLILPTRADCTPLAICEAFAFGVPVVATDTGGVGSLVSERTGALIPLEAPADDWARAVRGIVGDRAAYGRMAGDCRAEHTGRLNWDTSAARVVALLEAALTRSRTAGV